MTTMSEPLVHRFVVGKETLIFNHEPGEYILLCGTYEGIELVIRLTDQIVSEVKLEKTGSGWGFLLRQLPTIPVQEEAQGNRMKKYYFFLPITGILLFMLLVGCAKTRIGKVELSDEKLPNFLKVGTTRAQEVLEQIGDCLLYTSPSPRDRG